MPESRVLSVTEALCPVCLERLSATRELRGGAVWLCRVCPKHGKTEAVIWRGEPAFTSWQRSKTPSAPPVTATAIERGCPYDCGLCPEHGQHTCTAVVEVTERCDLCCPVCYASAGQGSKPDASPTDLISRLVDLRRTAGACNVQLSGGEPTSRDDLPLIIQAARAQGFGLVQLNTNGLRLGSEPGYAQKLAQAGLQSVFLQFDGPDEACLVLRGRPLLADKLCALDACAEAGLGVVLVPTLVRGVNDQALGEILALACARAPVVRGVHFQPASSFGRYPGALSFGPDESKRLTLPEVLTLLVAQSKGMLKPEDFHPPCCEHERCSFSARFALKEGKLTLLPDGGCCDASPLLPIVAAEGARRAKAAVAGQWAAAPAPLSQPPRDDFERFLATRGSDKRLSISCMAFQDAYTLDLERVRGCCIHTQTSDGRLIPFCLYNLTATDGRTLYRGHA
jgi:7,8-dihydro-6-hydroxymethylpterin dimethyltransferase